MLEHNGKHKVLNGTYYHCDTPDALVRELERCRVNDVRITLDYGDVDTGKSWGEHYDITGTLGRSTGPIKIPILLHNARSTGGVGILDHCILSVRASRGKEVLYKLDLSKSQPAHEGT